jgi:hypothetical protein
MCPAYYRQRDGIVKSVPGLIQRGERGFADRGPEKASVPHLAMPDVPSQPIVIGDGTGDLRADEMQAHASDGFTQEA